MTSKIQRTVAFEIHHPKPRDPSERPEVTPRFIAQGTCNSPARLTAWVEDDDGTPVQTGVRTRTVGHPRSRWNFTFMDIPDGDYQLCVKLRGGSPKKVPIRVASRRPYAPLEIYYPLDNESTPPYPTAYGSSTYDGVFVQFSEGTNNYPSEPREAQRWDAFWSADMNEVTPSPPQYTCKAGSDTSLSNLVQTYHISVGDMMLSDKPDEKA